MMQKIKCKTKTKAEAEKVKVRIIKAPLVDTEELHEIIFARTKALVL